MGKMQRFSEPRDEEVTVVAPLVSTISAVTLEGLSITTPDGRRATLAIMDEDGKIVEAGPSVMRAAWEVSIRSYRIFLTARGYLRIKTVPPDERKS